MKRVTLLRSLVILLALSAFASCGGGSASSVGSGGDTLSLDYSRLLTITEHDGFKKVTVRNPWDSTRILNTYILVPSADPLPKRLPAGTVVRTPVSAALIYSSVHNSLVCELGAPMAIKGVCDAQYIHEQFLKKRIADGAVADCGNSMSPDIERIIELSPDAILLSPFENSGGYGKLGQLGIPIVECADYMEISPLARAEWMRFYGMLFGREEYSDILFGQTVKEYNELAALVDTVSCRPKVLIDRLYGQSWYVPGAVSTMGRFIEDAGGTNPFDEYRRSGSIGLSAEEVLYKAQDADVWAIRYSQPADKSMDELGRDNAIYREFDAFKNKRVYGCNTRNVRFYEEVPFHPQWLLNDLIVLCHPELSQVKGNRYFTELVNE